MSQKYNNDEEIVMTDFDNAINKSKICHKQFCKDVRSIVPNIFYRIALKHFFDISILGVIGTWYITIYFPYLSDLSKLYVCEKYTKFIDTYMRNKTDGDTSSNKKIATDIAYVINDSRTDKTEDLATALTKYFYIQNKSTENAQEPIQRIYIMLDKVLNTKIDVIKAYEELNRLIQR